MIIKLFLDLILRFPTWNSGIYLEELLLRIETKQLDTYYALFAE